MDYSVIWISLKTTVCSSVIVFFLGTLAAWAVLRIKNLMIRHIVDSILMLPMVLPPTVAGFFLLLIFGVRGPAGLMLKNVFGIKVVFTWSATVIAAVAVSFPLMYRSVKAGFEQIHQNMIDEAKIMGMNNFAILWKILIPCTLPGVVAGIALSTTRGLGEFGATAMLAGNISGKTRTLPLAIYSEVAAGNMTSAWGYVSIILIIAFLSIICMNIWTDHSEIKL